MLDDAARRGLGAALIHDRYGPEAALPADLPAVDGLVEFEQGRVPPRTDETLGPMKVQPPSFDRALAEVAPAPPRAWPGGAPVAVALTHDVDLFDGTSLFPLRAAGWAVSTARDLTRGEWRRARQTARRAAAWTRWWLRGEDPVADFAGWQALEAEHGVRSTFFFLALERALSQEGRLYRVDDPRVVRVLRSLRRGGWEVGLHASRYGSGDADGLRAQRERLEAAAGGPVRAVRYHYLTGTFPEAWRQIEDAGFTVSSNVGFNPPHQGFRTGTAWPYRPLAHEGRGLWEAPMALMDVGVGPARPHLAAAFDHLLAQARAVGGLLVVNFHTNYRAEVDAPGVHAQYRRILGRVRDEAAAGRLVALTLAEAIAHLAD